MGGYLTDAGEVMLYLFLFSFGADCLLEALKMQRHVYGHNHRHLVVEFCVIEFVSYFHKWNFSSMFVKYLTAINRNTYNLHLVFLWLGCKVILGLIVDKYECVHVFR